MVGEPSTSEEPADPVDLLSFENITSTLLPAHRRCAAHGLALVATVDTLKGINNNENLKLMYEDVTAKCNVLWSLMRSPLNHETIYKELGEALKRPVITRWNSFYDAFEQLIKLKDKITILSTKLRVTDPLMENDYV